MKQFIFSPPTVAPSFTAAPHPQQQQRENPAAVLYRSHHPLKGNKPPGSNGEDRGGSSACAIGPSFSFQPIAGRLTGLAAVGGNLWRDANATQQAAGGRHEEEAGVRPRGVNQASDGAADSSPPKRRPLSAGVRPSHSYAAPPPPAVHRVAVTATPSLPLSPPAPDLFSSGIAVDATQINRGRFDPRATLFTVAKRTVLHERPSSLPHSPSSSAATAVVGSRRRADPLRAIAVAVAGPGGRRHHHDDDDGVEEEEGASSDNLPSGVGHRVRSAVRPWGSVSRSEFRPAAGDDPANSNRGGWAPTEEEGEQQKTEGMRGDAPRRLAGGCTTGSTEEPPPQQQGTTPQGSLRLRRHEEPCRRAVAIEEAARRLRRPMSAPLAARRAKAEAQQQVGGSGEAIPHEALPHEAIAAAVASAPHNLGEGLQALLEASVGHGGFTLERQPWAVVTLFETLCADLLHSRHHLDGGLGIAGGGRRPGATATRRPVFLARAEDTAARHVAVTVMAGDDSLANSNNKGKNATAPPAGGPPATTVGVAQLGLLVGTAAAIEQQQQQPRLFAEAAARSSPLRRPQSATTVRPVVASAAEPTASTAAARRPHSAGPVRRESFERHRHRHHGDNDGDSCAPRATGFPDQGGRVGPAVRDAGSWARFPVHFALKLGAPGDDNDAVGAAAAHVDPADPLAAVAAGKAQVALLRRRMRPLRTAGGFYVAMDTKRYRGGSKQPPPGAPSSENHAKDSIEKSTASSL